MTINVDNRDKLKQLLMDIFLITESEFRFDLTRKDLHLWDSLAMVSIAVGLNETFGYHPTPEEAMKLHSVSEIINLLQSKGIPCDP